MPCLLRDSALNTPDDEAFEGWMLPGAPMDDAPLFAPDGEIETEVGEEVAGPPLIAQGTFAPTNQWLYYIQPAVRTTFPNGLPLKVATQTGPGHGDCAPPRFVVGQRDPQCHRDWSKYPMPWS